MSEPTHAKQTRWGIIATGSIAGKLAAGIAEVPESRLWSVVSRDPERAAAFAREHGAERSFSDLDAFLADPELEAVVVCTPHTLHYENTLRCLEAGKHVLCEKPMGLNLAQVNRMIETAQAQERFLMEAMWMWFFPAIREAKRRIEAGEIGDPRLITAEFGFSVPVDPSSRLFSPALGGGTLLDIGIYPLALALYLFGKPDHLTGEAVIGSTGVDEQSTVSLRWNDGRMANGTASFQAHASCEAMISGSEGRLRIHREFWNPRRLGLIRGRHGEEEILDLPCIGNGYAHEIMEVERCLREGRLESDVMSFQASRDLISMMDQLRERWDLRYPDEA